MGTWPALQGPLATREQVEPGYHDAPSVDQPLTIVFAKVRGGANWLDLVHTGAGCAWGAVRCRSCLQSPVIHDLVSRHRFNCITSCAFNAGHT